MDDLLTHGLSPYSQFLIESVLPNIHVEALTSKVVILECRGLCRKLVLGEAIRIIALG
jgi:hypothetical protein